MIYMVELNYSDPSTVTESSAWYDTYLQQLVTVPGLLTAQRYRAVNGNSAAWQYLAI